MGHYNVSRWQGKCTPTLAPVSNFRRILPQVLCSFPMSLICVNIGTALSFPTLVVQSVSSNVTQEQSLTSPGFFKTLILDESQVSLYVSLAYLCQPIGSILGGMAISPIGRKNLMLFVNLPFLLGWLSLFFSQSPVWMYVSNFLLGMGIGCCESTFATYVPEISEPGLRGILVGKVLFCFSASMVLPYLIYLVLPDWRWASLALASTSIVTFLVTLSVPETPHWLVSKGKVHRAEKALMMLRGWVSRDHIKQELEDIVRYHKDIASPPGTPAASTVNLVGAKEGWREKLKYMISQRMLRPFVLICSMFIFLYLAGISTIRPFFGKIFEHMNFQTDFESTSMMITIFGVVGSGVNFLIIKLTGKKKLLIGSYLFSALLSLLLVLSNKRIIPVDTSVYWFSGLAFFTSLGILPVPWMMQGDLFPFRGRGMASGLAAAFNYLTGFVCTNRFLSVMNLISLNTVFILFTCFNLFASVLFSFWAPETEGKTFEEIDEYYSKSAR